MDFFPCLKHLRRSLTHTHTYISYIYIYTHLPPPKLLANYIKECNLWFSFECMCTYIYALNLLALASQLNVLSSSIALCLFILSCLNKEVSGDHFVLPSECIWDLSQELHQRYQVFCKTCKTFGDYIYHNN